MQLQLTTKRQLYHCTLDACQTIRNYPGIFERMRRSMMRRIEACIESDGVHFEHLMYSFSYNSQMFTGHANEYMDIFYCFGIRNSCPKSVRIFQLRPT
jgi:hypothetical protein